MAMWTRSRSDAYEDEGENFCYTLLLKLEQEQIQIYFVLPLKDSAKISNIFVNMMILIFVLWSSPDDF